MIGRSVLSWLRAWPVGWLYGIHAPASDPPGSFIFSGLPFPAGLWIFLSAATLSLSACNLLLSIARFPEGDPAIL